MAIADFTEAITLDPKHSDAYINRGMAWSIEGDNDNAIADFTDAIKLDPKRGFAFQACVVKERRLRQSNR